MTDEEKKAIEILKDREYDFDELYCTFRQSFIKPYDKSIGIILELIEKQQKEIEELKEKNRQSKMRIAQLENEITARIEDVNQYYTPNDKIKAKIEEIDKKLEYETNGWESEYEYCKEVLQSLLEKEE